MRLTLLSSPTARRAAQRRERVLVRKRHIATTPSPHGLSSNRRVVRTGHSAPALPARISPLRLRRSPDGCSLAALSPSRLEASAEHDHGELLVPDAGEDDDTARLRAGEASSQGLLYEVGKSLGWIGARFGVSNTAIAAELRKQGVQLRPRPGWG